MTVLALLVRQQSDHLVRVGRALVSHAIKSSMQSEDSIAYAIMSAGRFCICNHVRPDAAA